VITYNTAKDNTALQDKPVRTALWAWIRRVFWVHLAWEPSASQPQEAEPRALLAVALYGSLSAEASELAAAPAAPEEQPEQGAPAAEPEVAYAREE
jgi:hypothetical protein